MNVVKLLDLLIDMEADKEASKKATAVFRRVVDEAAAKSASPDFRALLETLEASEETKAELEALMLESEEGVYNSGDYYRETGS